MYIQVFGRPSGAVKLYLGALRAPFGRNGLGVVYNGKTYIAYETLQFIISL